MEYECYDGFCIDVDDLGDHKPNCIDQKIDLPYLGRTSNLDGAGDWTMEFGNSPEGVGQVSLELGMLFYPDFLIIRILDVSGYVKKLSRYPRIDE